MRVGEYTATSGAVCHSGQVQLTAKITSQPVRPPTDTPVNVQQWRLINIYFIFLFMLLIFCICISNNICNHTDLNRLVHECMTLLCA